MSTYLSMLLLITSMSCIAYFIYARKSNPFFLFLLFGFIFYWITPVVAIVNLPSEYATLVIGRYADLMSDRNIFVTMTMFALAISSAAIGYKIGKWAPGTITAPNSNTSNISPETNSICQIAFLLIALLLAVQLFSIRDNLFSGYQTQSEALESAKGSASAMAFMLAVIAGVGLIPKTDRSLIWLVSSPYGLAICLSWIMLIGLGGRLYVATGAIYFLLLQTNNGLCLGTWIKHNFIWCLLAASLIGIIGIMRLGNSISVDGFVGNILGEPFWTSHSMFSCIEQYNKIDLFQTPYNFMSSFVGIIPSAVIDKSTHIIPLISMGYDISSPLGACSNYAQALCNFGFAGTLIFFGVYGGYFGLLHNLSRDNNRTKSVILCSSLSVVPFCFFRDPFSISIFQMTLKNCLLLPLSLILISWLFRNTEPSVPSP